MLARSTVTVLQCGMISSTDRLSGTTEENPICQVYLFMLEQFENGAVSLCNCLHEYVPFLYDFMGIVQFSRRISIHLPLTQLAIKIGIVSNIPKMTAPIVNKIVGRDAYDES